MSDDANHFLDAGGRMAAVMRAHDWSQTPLGPPTCWPQSLRSVVSVLLTSRFAMWMGWGPDLTFFYNDAYGPTLGIKEGRALGRPSREVWAEIWNDVGPRIDQVLATGIATWDQSLLLFLQRSGFREETYHTFSYSPLRDDAGAIAGNLCVVSEETKRVIGERQLDTLRRLASHLAAAVTEAEALAAITAGLAANLHDLPFSLTYLYGADDAAPQLAASTGFPAGSDASGFLSSMAWPSPETWHDTGRIEIDRLGDRAAGLPMGAWAEPPHRALLVPVARPGQERPAGFLMVGLNPHRALDDSYGDFLALIAGQVASGLANARAYEEERRRAEALAALDRAKTAFFSNVSHEFRTPLTLLMGPLQEALTQPDDTTLAQLRPLLEVGNRNAQRLLRQVNTLLDFSRLEAQQLEGRFRPIDLAGLTAELAGSFREAMARAGLAFRIDCPPLPEIVYVDGEMWERIVLNLLSNALKFTLQGEIRVELHAQAGNAVLTVRDTGIGVAPDQLPRLFERFHRVEGARGRSHEGSGIGLALVRDLARLHGGDAAVESAPGQGSAFTVSIPLGRAHLPADRVSEAPAIAAGRQGEAFLQEAFSWLDEGGPALDAPVEIDIAAAAPGQAGIVLLADDNTDMRNYVARLLHAAGLEVITAPDGLAALALARAKKPDLVLSDVMMPRLDGLGLVRAIRADPDIGEIPVILLTARAGEDSRVSGLETEADDYLVKPFSPRELLARVKGSLATARLRQQARDAAHRREHRLRLILDGAREYAIIAIGPTGLITEWNEGAGRVLGYPAGEALGRSWEMLFTTGDIADGVPTAELAQARDHGKSENARWHRRRDGTLFWAYGVVMKLMDGDRHDGFLTIFRDRTAEQMAEAALRDSEAKYRDLAATLERQVAERTADRNRLWQLSTDLIVVARFDGTITALNPAWETLLGWRESDLVGTNLVVLLHPDDRTRSRAAMVELAGGATLHRFENRYRHADGSDRWISWTAVPADGLLIAVGRDFTAERERAAALELSEARLRSVFETSYQHQGLLSTEGIVLDANSRSLADIGARLDDVAGEVFAHTPWFAGTPGMPEQVAAAIRLAAQGQSFRKEIVLSLPDGQRAFDFSVRPVLNAAGAVIAIVPEAMEVTERRAAEEQLRQAQKMEAVGQLTGGLAHDFNNLLTAISGSLELLATRVTQGRTGELDRYLAAAQGASKRAAALTHRLLAFSRRQTLDPKPTDINRLVVGMEELIRRTVGPEIALEVVTAAGLWSTLIDQSQLENALLNLCINARDAMPDGGRLTVETANRWLDGRVASERGLAPGQYLSLCVSDTGTGMTPEVISRAFDPFFTTKPIGAGTGLGLSMIYGFARQSGGAVRIYSEVGHGTMVCLYLPRAAQADEGVQTTDKHLEAPMAVGAERVLIVDDEAVIRMLVSDTLDDLGYTTIEAADGGEGLRVVQSSAQIDLLVTDIGLPGGMNGRQLADAARALRPDLKVLFITGYAENAVIGQGRLQPGMHVMTKPFEIEVLASRIRDILKK